MDQESKRRERSLLIERFNGITLATGNLLVLDFQILPVKDLFENLKKNKRKRKKKKKFKL